MKPPAAAALLLRAVAPRDWSEAMRGDLDEEFGTFADGRAARRWYWSQVLRSAAPLVAARFRLSPATLLAGLAGGPLPLWLLDRLWTYVYSQIPMKEGAVRAPEMLLATAITVLLAACAAGFLRGRDAFACLLACAGIAAAGLHPAASALGVVLVAGSYLAGVRLGRRKEAA